MRMSLTDQNRILLSNILVLSGAIIIVFIYVVPYGFDMKYEDLIFFKGVLLGSAMCFLGFALRIVDFIRDVLITLGIGQLALLFMSVFNYCFDSLIQTRLLFLITLIVMGSTLLMLTIIRLWINPIITLVINVKKCVNEMLSSYIITTKAWLRRILASWKH